MSTRRVTLATLAAAALTAGLTGCGSSTPSNTPAGGAPPTSAPAGGASATDGGGPAPQESNPVGDIPDDTAFVAFRASSGQYEIKVPEGWARTATGAAVSFTDKLNTVRVETVTTASAPTVESARTSEVPPIQAASRRFSLQKVSTVTRTAGDAVLITYRADSPVDPVTNKVVPDAVERYEFWKAGTEVVLTLSGPVNADNVDPWRTVTDSFRWLA
jgi:hypothetical protein